MPMQEDSAIRVRFEAGVLTLQLARPESGNTINRTLVDEATRALREHEQQARIVVLEGSPEVFCLGADFRAVQAHRADPTLPDQDPEPMYELWRRLVLGEFISVAHVRGKVNAGGVGFVAACDVVLAEEKATFGLSEMLFGLLPACVLPFLARRIGLARANYLTLSTQPITARQAEQWGLVDACESDSSQLLRKHLLRLGRLTKPAIARYKRYAGQLDASLTQSRAAALAANAEAFSDPVNLSHIERFVTTGRFPWDN